LGEVTLAIKSYNLAIDIADKIFIGIQSNAKDATDADSIIGNLNEERTLYASYQFKLGCVYESMKTVTSIDNFY